MSNIFQDTVLTTGCTGRLADRQTYEQPVNYASELTDVGVGHYGDRK